MLSQKSLRDLIAVEFPHSNDSCYLNHARLSKWPVRTARAVQQFAEESVTGGVHNYTAWLACEKKLREQLRDLIGAAKVAEIALTKNTSEALSIIAFGLHWQAGDEIVIADEEFPSNRLVWEAVAQRYAVRLVTVNLRQAESPEAAILQKVTPRTRLVSVSSVQYGTGLRIQPVLLGPALRDRNVLFCLDAIQSVGACALHVESDAVDFLVAGAHKWMMGPEGIGLLYVRKARQDDIQLQQFGWRMIKAGNNFSAESNNPADDATRFECGSINLLGVRALSASLSLIQDVGIDAIEHLICQHARFIGDFFAQFPEFELATDCSPGRHLGIVTVKPRYVPVDAVMASLAKAGVVCAQRAGGLRFSPNFYTSELEISKACEQALTLARELE